MQVPCWSYRRSRRMLFSIIWLFSNQRLRNFKFFLITYNSRFWFQITFQVRSYVFELGPGSTCTSRPVYNSGSVAEELLNSSGKKRLYQTLNTHFICFGTISSLIRMNRRVEAIAALPSRPVNHVLNRKDYVTRFCVSLLRQDFAIWTLTLFEAI